MLQKIHHSYQRRMARWRHAYHNTSYSLNKLWRSGELWISNERPQWSLWWSVAFAHGIGLYVVLSFEPQWYVGIVSVIAALIILQVAQRLWSNSSFTEWLCKLLLWGTIGFAWMQLHAQYRYHQSLHKHESTLSQYHLQHTKDILSHKKSSSLSKQNIDFLQPLVSLAAYDHQQALSQQKYHKKKAHKKTILRRQHKNAKSIAPRTMPTHNAAAFKNGLFDGFFHQLAHLFKNHLFRLNTLKGLYHLVGVVRNVEQTPYGQRIILNVTNLNHMTIRSSLMRLNMRHHDDIQPHDMLHCIAMLTPPLAPASPFGYDFARQSFFEGIQAKGQVRRIIALTPTAHSIDNTRHQLTMHWASILPKPLHLLMAALTTGEKGDMPQHIRQAFSNSGLSHILAISGLHFSIVIGLFFFILKWLLHRAPLWCLYIPIPITASLGACVLASGYFLLSGGSFSVTRAFCMAIMAMSSVILGKRAQAKHILSASALVILSLWPQALFTASFQLSYASVFALVALHQPISYWFQNRFIHQKATKDYYNTTIDLQQNAHVHNHDIYGATYVKTLNGLRKSLYYIAQNTLSTGVATLVTTPLTIWIFGTFTAQAITANALAIPFTAFILMPLCTAATIHTLLGWWGHTLWSLPLTYALKTLLMIAQKVSMLPGSFFVCAKPSIWVVIALLWGVLWVGLWTNKKTNIIGYLLLSIGAICFVIQCMFPAPLVRFDPMHNIFGIEDHGRSTLYVSSMHRPFTLETWRQESGLKTIAPLPNAVLFDHHVWPVAKGTLFYKDPKSNRWIICQAQQTYDLQRHVITMGGASETGGITFNTKNQDIHSYHHVQGKRLWHAIYHQDDLHFTKIVT